MTKAFPEIAMIVAIIGPRRAIGNEGKLIAPISDDLKRFKVLTTGHAIIMGRRTYESIGRALPNRENIVITRNRDFKAPGIVTSASLEEALDHAADWEMKSPMEHKEIFIIGGGEIYNQALPRANKLYLTLIESDAKGDVFFPDYSDFKKVIKQEERTDGKTGLKYSWVDLEK